MKQQKRMLLGDVIRRTAHRLPVQHGVSDLQQGGRERPEATEGVRLRRVSEEARKQLTHAFLVVRTAQALRIDDMEEVARIERVGRLQVQF